MLPINVGLLFEYPATIPVPLPVIVLPWYRPLLLFRYTPMLFPVMVLSSYVPLLSSVRSPVPLPVIVQPELRTVCVGQALA